ncbi:MAG: glycosyltransferase family 2 protein [Mucilaginibacter sp.]
MQQGGLRTGDKNNRQPLVSVVTVTYNAAQTLPQLVESIRQQKSNDIEFVVVDGNSTDNTIDILKANNDIVDFWISEPDNGIYDAMNKSLKYFKGQWVVFLGADDLLMDDFLKMVAILKDPTTIYYGNVIFYGKPFYKVYDDYYLTKLNICHQAIFYPRAVFEKYQYDLQYKVYADYHLNLRCWHDPKFKFEHKDYLVASFPEGGFSTYTKDPVFENDRDMLFKKYLKRKSYYRYLNRSIGFWGMFKRFIQNK